MGEPAGGANRIPLDRRCSHEFTRMRRLATSEVADRTAARCCSAAFPRSPPEFSQKNAFRKSNHCSSETRTAIRGRRVKRARRGWSLRPRATKATRSRARSLSRDGSHLAVSDVGEAKAGVQREQAVARAARPQREAARLPKPERRPFASARPAARATTLASAGDGLNSFEWRGGGGGPRSALGRWHTCACAPDSIPPLSPPFNGSERCVPARRRTRV